MEWKIFGMEWKKIASMEYGKIVFHSIPYHALAITWVPKITYQYKFFNSFITSTVIFSEKVVAIRKRRARKQKKMDYSFVRKLFSVELKLYLQTKAKLGSISFELKHQTL